MVENSGGAKGFTRYKTKYLNLIYSQSHNIYIGNEI